jgi:hypothetical protein
MDVRYTRITGRMQNLPHELVPQDISASQGGHKFTISSNTIDS